MRTLTVQIEPDLDADTEQFVQLAERGLASGQYQGDFLTFATPAVLFDQLTSNRWQMVDRLLGAGVVGVRELARRLGRDVRRVHEDAAVLVRLGLLEKTDTGALCCPYGRIHINMALPAPELARPLPPDGNTVHGDTHTMTRESRLHAQAA